MSCPWWDNDDDGSPEYRVHVSNLPWRTDEDSLMDAFADYKPIYADVSGYRIMRSIPSRYDASVRVFPLSVRC
jgi:hypothetical protein